MKAFLIASSNIHEAKWNACIQNSSHPLIYATTQYLNAMAKNWHGLVVNDYETIMPIVWKKKYGIRYSYMVPFVQQLGWFSTKQETVDLSLLNELFHFCRYGDYPIHSSITFNNENISLTASTNLILSLSQSYEAISGGYHKELQQNLAKAKQSDVEYGVCDWKWVIKEFQKMYSVRMPHIKHEHYVQFANLCAWYAAQNKLIVRGIRERKNGHFLCGGIFLLEYNRLYNLMNVILEVARKRKANSYLFDRLFHEFSNSGWLFDFEGSDVPGIQYFYKKFGAEVQPYYRMHWNELPIPLRWLKR